MGIVYGRHCGVRRHRGHWIARVVPP
jgi:hypothetical protein